MMIYKISTIGWKRVRTSHPFQWRIPAWAYEQV